MLFLFVILSIVGRIFLEEVPFVEEVEEVIEKEIECSPDYKPPGPGELVEFFFPDISEVTRETMIDHDQMVHLYIYNIPLPLGLGLYVRTEPYDPLKVKFVGNRYLDSGVNFKLLNKTHIIYEDEDKLFLNYRYESELVEDAKCRSYNIHIQYPIKDMIKYGENTVNERGMLLEVLFFYGYVLRNLNQTSADEPVFIHSESVLNSYIGVMRKDDNYDEDL